MFGCMKILMTAYAMNSKYVTNLLDEKDRLGYDRFE
jgi:hypothetical protein